MKGPPRLAGRGPVLDDLLRMVQDQEIRLVQLSGPAGIGKSRLLLALEERCSDRMLTISQACGSVDAAEGGALGNALYRLNRLLSPEELLQLFEEPSLRRLFCICPSLRGREGAPVSGAPSHGQDAGDEFCFMPVLESLVGLMERLTRQRPLLVLVDDLQLMDAPSRNMLEALMSHPVFEGLQLTFFVTCRDEQDLPFADKWRQLMDVSPGRRRVAVEPLDEAGIEELIVDELDSGVPANHGELVECLHRHSAGLPFTALQLMRHARRTGLVRATLSGWQVGPLDELGELARGRLLEDLAAPVLTRTPLSRFLLTWLNAARVPVELEPLKRVTPAVAGEWESIAMELRRLGVLQRRENEEGRVQWRFAHALWADSASNLLEPQERLDFLLQIAEGLDPNVFEERLLQAELLSQVWQEQVSENGRSESHRRKAASLIERILREDSGDSQSLGLRLRLAERLVELAPGKSGYSLAIRTLLEGNLSIQSTEAFAHWLECADMDRLDGETRLLVLQHGPRRFILRDQLRDIPEWVARQEARPDLNDPERAALLLVRLQRRYANTDWAGAEGEFARIESLEALPSQRVWARILHLFSGLGSGDALVRFKELEQLLEDGEGLLDDTQRLAVFGEMYTLIRLHGQSPLMNRWHDQMLAIVERESASTVANHRVRRALTLMIVGRLAEAESILRENLEFHMRRKDQVLIIEAAHGVLGLLRQQRRLAEAADLALRVAPLLGGEPGSYMWRAVLLTCVSVFWRTHRTADAARLLKLADRFIPEELAPEITMSWHYCRTMVRLQEAEAGGDWSLVAEAAEGILERYAQLKRRDIEMLSFSIIKDRALAQLHGPDDSRRAADYLVSVETAKSRREYDLVRFLAQIGELALLTGETGVVDEVLKSLDGVEADEELAAAFRLACAVQRGRMAEARSHLLEAACHAHGKGLDDLTAHLLRRFPGIEAWPLPPALSGRQLCLWAWSLAEWLQRGLAVRLPGLDVATEARPAFIRRALVELRERKSRLARADAKRLDVELNRLDLWHADHGTGAQGSPLHLHLFGGPCLIHQGRSLDPSQLHTRVGLELLALLAVRSWQGRGRLPRGEILEALTLDGRPLLSEGSLRVVVARLRKALLEIHPVALDGAAGQGYALASDLLGPLDVADFDDAWRRTQDALHLGKSEEAINCLEQGIALYRGAFMPGGCAWTIPLRGHFERRFLDMVRRRLELMQETAEARRMLEELRGRLPELADYLQEESFGIRTTAGRD